MLVTDKKYYMDDAYIRKLDMMIERMKGTDDNLLIIDGDEGQGKTEFTVGTCYYISNMMGREYSVDNIFFDLDEGIKFAASTKEQIIHLDEGALGLLTIQWWKKNQQKFIQLVMVARKKKHFIAICIPKFYKLNQYIVEDRSIGLAHIYSRKNMQKGRFSYYTKGAKEKLYSDWTRRKLKNYRKYAVIRGSFVQAMHRVFTQEQIDAYEAKKDQAIMDLTKDEKKPLTPTQEKHLNQRDKMICILSKEREFSLREFEKYLKEQGIILAKDQINNILKNNIPLEGAGIV